MGLNVTVSLGLLTVVFALLFKYIPDAKVKWGDVGVGAVITAVLFTAGKMVLNWHLGQGIGSAYGAAGSLVVLLAWIYYSTLIVFLGAEFTQAYARASGREIEPNAYSVRIAEGGGGQSTETAE